MTWRDSTERTDLAELRREMQSDIAELRREMREEIGRLKVEIAQRHADGLQWSLVFSLGAAFTVAILAASLS